MKPEVELGICGEHGGDARSVAFCLELGLDYVPGSPYRVPLARLAAVQAVLVKRGIEAAQVGGEAPRFGFDTGAEQQTQSAWRTRSRWMA